MRIVPSADIGDLGPSQGQALAYDWKWYYSAMGALVWLPLVLALAIPPANRNRRALLILVPLVVVVSLWSLFKKAVGMPSSSAYRFDVWAGSLAAGLAVLWLLAPYLALARGTARFFGAIALLVAVAYVGSLAYGTWFSSDTVLHLIVLVLLGLVLLTGIAVAARRYRRGGGPVRFMLWLALWTAVGGLAAMSGYFVVVTGVLSSALRGAELARMLPQVCLVGLMLGMCVYVLNLPFMILGFVSPFFRERMQACLGLNPVPKGPDVTVPPQAAEPFERAVDKIGGQG